MGNPQWKGFPPFAVTVDLIRVSLTYLNALDSLPTSPPSSGQRIALSMWDLSYDTLKTITASDIIVIALIVSCSRFLIYRTYGLIVLPGTFVHELCHFIVALLLNGHPRGFSVMPRRSPDGGLQLGSVSIGNLRWYNCVPITMAPLAGILLIHPLYTFWDSYMPANWYLLKFWLLVSIATSIVPSSADIRLALSQPLGLGFYLIALASSIWLYYSL